MRNPAKPSLSLPELVERIANVKKQNPSMTAKQVMAEIRKSASFSKDKWNAAKKEVAWETKPSAKPAKAPAKQSSKVRPPKSVFACCEICCNPESEAVSDKDECEFFDEIDALQDNAEDFVCALVATLKKKSSDDVVLLDRCPVAEPTLFAVLDKAVEAGLLKKFHGYALGDAYRNKKIAKGKSKGNDKPKK